MRLELATPTLSWRTKAGVYICKSFSLTALTQSHTTKEFRIMHTSWYAVGRSRGPFVV
jgi:hypothetical protein